MRKSCYHGTKGNEEQSINNILKNILEEGFKFHKRDDHWLGNGIYFFSEKTWAINWVNKSKYGFAILKAEISCEDKEYFDLDLPKNQHKLVEYIREIDTELKKQNKAVVFKENEKDKQRCFYLDIIKEKYDYKILKHTFLLKNANKITSDMGFCVTQVQFCVTDKKNIKIYEIEDVEEAGKVILRKKRKLG